MSIQKRGRGRYLVRWPGFKSVVLPSREAAEQLELHYKLSARLGELYEDAETTLGEEIESYIAWKETAGDIRPRTLEYLNRSAAFWKPHRGKRCSQLRRAELEDAIVERARNHPRSAKNELELLKAVLRRAHERGQRIDGRILRIPAIRHTAREGIALTAEELHELASWFPESHKRLVLLAGTVARDRTSGSRSTSARSSSTAPSLSCGFPGFTTRAVTRRRYRSRCAKRCY